MPISKLNQTISVTLPAEYVDKLDKLAKQDDRSRGYIVARIVKSYIDKIYDNKEKRAD